MTDENLTAADDTTMESASSDKAKSSGRADAKTRKARRVFGVIMIILVLLLAAVTALFIRAVAPVGGPSKKVDVTGLEWVRSIYGYGSAQEDQLNSPNDVAIGDNGTIWVADTSHARVVGFAPDGAYRGLIHQGPAFSNPKALQSPVGVDVDERGDVWVADFGREMVTVFTSDNEVVREFEVPLPTKLSVSDGRVAVGSYNGIAITNEEGELIKLLGAHGDAADEFDNVQGIYIDEDGTIYCCDTHNNRLRAFDRNGQVLWSRQLGNPSNKALAQNKKENTATANAKFAVQMPAGLTMDGAGRLVFVDPFEFSLVVADPEDGTIIAKYGEDGTDDGKFAYPTGIDYDPRRDWFAVADTSNNRVQIVRIPGSGADPIAALRRLTTGWLKICGIPLLLLLVALITTALMRRRKNADKKREEDKDESDTEDGSVIGVEAASPGSGADTEK